MCNRKAFRPVQIDQLQELDFLLKNKGVFMWLNINCIFKNYPQGTLVSSSKAAFEGRCKMGSTKMFLY